MGSLQFPNMGMGLRLAAFGRRSSAIIVWTGDIKLKKEYEKENENTSRLWYSCTSIKPDLKKNYIVTDGIICVWCVPWISITLFEPKYDNFLYISFNFSYVSERREKYTSKQKMPLSLAPQVLLPAGRKSEMQQIDS